jgi:hypothetical protein
MRTIKFFTVEPSPLAILYWAQKFVSGSFFQIHLVYIHPSMQDTLFHNHTAQLAIILIIILLLLICHINFIVDLIIICMLNAFI